MIWQSESKQDVVAALGTNVTMGLSKQEVAQARKTYGLNVLREKPPVSWIRRFFGQFATAFRTCFGSF